LLLVLSLPAASHNGANAIAVPVEGIKVDGDLSDWPEGMKRYPIALAEIGDKPKDKQDYQGGLSLFDGQVFQRLISREGLADDWIIALLQTNLVARTTVRADQLRQEEFAEGGKLLAAKVRRYRPQVLALLGLGAYRSAFGRSGAAVGPQEEHLGQTQVWVLPNPSGLNAHYSLETLAGLFCTLRQQVEQGGGNGRRR